LLSDCALEYAIKDVQKSGRTGIECLLRTDEVKLLREYKYHKTHTEAELNHSKEVGIGGNKRELIVCSCLVVRIQDKTIVEWQLINPLKMWQSSSTWTDS